jgi:hypothetical protein
VEKAPLTAKQLNDSVAADHACFADSADVSCTMGCLMALCGEDMTAMKARGKAQIP